MYSFMKYQSFVFFSELKKVGFATSQAKFAASKGSKLKNQTSMYLMYAKEKQTCYLYCASVFLQVQKKKKPTQNSPKEL